MEALKAIEQGSPRRTETLYRHVADRASDRVWTEHDKPLCGGHGTDFGCVDNH